MTGQLTAFIMDYGYVAVFLLVMAESLGVPVPGETALIAASIYAGTTHQLRIEWVVLSAAAGAIAGDNVGYWLGSRIGYRLVLRYGARFGLGERKIKLGQYLFMRHGGKVVFFGRFIAFLRALAAFLAGLNRMAWWKFFLANAAGGVVWAAAYGIGAYVLGSEIERTTGTLRLAVVVAAFAALVLGAFLLHRSETRLEEAAERALPGPLAQP